MDVHGALGHVALVRVRAGTRRRRPAAAAGDRSAGPGLGRGGRLVHAELVLALAKRLGDQHVHGRRLEAEVGLERAPPGDRAAGAIRRAICSASRLGAASPRSSDCTSPSTRNSTGAARARRRHRARGRVGQLLAAAAWRPPARAPRLRIGSRNVRLRAIDGRRNDRDERLGRAPQRLVEAAEHLGLEAGGERRARLRRSISPMREAEPAHERRARLGDSRSAASGRSWSAAALPRPAARSAARRASRP